MLLHRPDFSTIDPALRQIEARGGCLDWVCFQISFDLFGPFLAREVSQRLDEARGFILAKYGPVASILDPNWALQRGLGPT